MAIVDVTIIPIGTDTPSVSKFVADIQRILIKWSEEGKITYELTPMSTLIEGELSTLFEVVKEMHESPFIKGIERVATNIRIDDRRDRNDHSMQNKLASVQHHLLEQ
ncbi:MTH1187 family thiamine-binding protein [Jeotgalibacillus sp. S-D1]|uniref:MTH1187 family thiamine-binding protein n=1 Tax=Jeotgalibacillus sp. S-D1 TaxID=2552189 RepID=UPI00105A6DB8|nr:MTH1187 family thiamine-binding protein [Jeotgalibacillus sp. S-D1]TDL34548.1 MTH1187 family thiamine-binding protein [Jeotgalibacillus sp. S-D1]